jgi:TolA-binding protein
MSVIDIHPEEFFDKLVSGRLSVDERERLQAHLSTCETCRFELSVRGDFQAELSALEALAPLPAAPVPHAVRPRLRSRARRRALIVGLAAAALFIASGALASVITGQSPWGLIVALASDDTPAPSPSVVARAKPRVPRAAPVEAPVVTPPSEPGSELAVATDQAASDAPLIAPQKGAPRADARPSVATPSAAELFASANQARTSKETRRAVELYRLLQQRYPRSPEAELSRVTLASLLLHVGDARAALGAFDGYLSSGKRPLESEALVGRALSLRALGLRDQEIAAWKLVLQRNPGTSYERRARERLSALGQP